MPEPTAASARASASLGPRTAIVVLTGIWWRLGSGTPCSASVFVAWLRALASHLALWLSEWFQNGAHSAHPAGPCTRTPSRTVIPRKRTRMAIEKTSTRSMLSHSAAAGGGHCLRIVSSMAPIIPLFLSDDAAQRSRIASAHVSPSAARPPPRRARPPNAHASA